MLIYSIALLALAAVFGIYMIFRVFGGALPPWGAAILHGLFAATGLVILLYATFLAGTPQPQAVVIAAILLVVAALGGFVLVSFHIRKQVPPKALAGVHALLAVAGVGTLALSLLGVV
jgi:hypothetical protein